MMDTRHLLFMLIFSLMAVSCTQEDLSIEALNPNERTVTLKVSVEGNNPTKVGFDEKGKFYWSALDQIGVTTTESNGYFSPLELKQGSGNASATFQGKVQGNVTQYAVYPYHERHNVYQGTLTYHFPSSYTYTKIDTDFFSGEKGSGNSFNMPMWGNLGEGNIIMKHLGGVLCIKIEQLPVDHPLSATKSSYIEIRTKGKRINGSYSTDLNAAEPVLSVLDTPNSDKQTVKIFFNNDQKNRSGVFYVPVPTGQYNDIIIGISDGRVIDEYNMGTRSIGRRTLNKLTVKNGSGGETTDPEEIAKWANKTFWVKGIHVPALDQWGIAFNVKGQITPGLEWKREYGWYDCTKKDPAQPTYDDSALCWAATISNMIYWWLDQNQANIDKYGKYKGPKIYNNALDCEVFHYFKKYFGNNGNDLTKTMDWFFRGTPADNLELHDHEGFLKDVFTSTMTRKGPGINLNADFKQAFTDGESIGMTISTKNSSHAISVWGAEFDEKGEVCQLYIVENNDPDALKYGISPMQPGKECPLGLYPKKIQKQKDGLYYLEGSTPGSFSNAIIEFHYMGTHDKEWAEYFQNHSN